MSLHLRGLQSQMPHSLINRLLILIPVLALALGGCSKSQQSVEPGSSGDKPGQLDALSQLLTPQGRVIAGATVKVSLLDGTLLAHATTTDAFVENGPDIAQANSNSGRVEASFQAKPSVSALCHLAVSGGEIVMLHKGQAIRLENDLAPENIVPCRVLDQHNLPPGAAPPGVALNEVTTTILDVIRLYFSLDTPGIDLAQVLDTVAIQLLGPSAADLDGDSVTTYADFSLLPAQFHRSLDLDHVIETVHDAVEGLLGGGSFERPNVILIVGDDLGYGDVSAFWPEGRIDTPNIDRIAADGAKFTSFHVQPVCAATRASLLTGRFHRQLAMRGAGGPARAGIPRWARTIPETLRQVGYRTAAYGKWHLSFRRGFLPPDRGFQDWLGFYGGSSPYSLELINERSQRFLFENYEPYRQPKGHVTDLFADRALGFIERNREESFFLYLAFNAAHEPIWNKESQVFSARPDWLRRVQADGVTGERQQDYTAVVRHMDERIGDILDLLDDLQLARRTIVIFLSDNGAEDAAFRMEIGATGSNGPFRGGKSNVYEGGTRVPMLMQWPGTIKAGTTVDQFTMMVDIWPTLREAIGLHEGHGQQRVPVQGDSLIPALSGKKLAAPGSAREGLFLFPLTGLALYNPPWKLIRNADGSRELYNLTDEPTESKPLNKSHPEVLLRMDERVDQLLRGAP